MRTPFVFLGAAALALLIGSSHTQADPQTSPAKPESKPARLDALGDALPDGAIARLGTLRMRLQSDMATALTISPDGKTIATMGHGDQAIKMWDSASGKEIRRLEVDPDRAVFALAFSPDGKWLASGSGLASALTGPNVPRSIDFKVPSQVLLWDVQSGKKLRELTGPLAGTMFSVAFTDNGKTLVSACGNGIVQWWDTATGKLLKTWDALAAQPPAAKPKWDWERLMVLDGAMLSPDSGALAVAHSNKWVPDKKTERNTIVWDLATGKKLLEKAHDEFNRSHAVFSGDGKHFAWATSNSEVFLWTLGANHPPEKLDNTWRASLHGIAFAPDGKTLGVFSYHGSVHLFDVAGKKLLRESKHNLVAFHFTLESRLLFFPDSKTMLTVHGGLFQIWDAKDFSEKLPMPAHRRTVSTLSFSPDGKQLLSAESRSVPLRWQTKSWQLIGPTKGFENVGESYRAHSDDCSLMLTQNPKNKACVHEMESGKLLCALDFDAEIDSPENTSFMPSGKQLAVLETVSNKTNLLLFSVTTGKLLRRRSLARELSFREMAFSSDDSALAVQSENGVTQVINLFTGAEFSLGKSRKPDNFARQGGQFKFSPNQRYLAVHDGSYRGFELWNLQTKKDLSGGSNVVPIVADSLGVPLDPMMGLPAIKNTGPMEIVRQAQQVVFSPDSRMLAVGNGKEIYVLEMATLKIRCKFSGHEAPVTALAWSPDGRVLVSGSADTTILVWDLAALRKV